MFSKSLLNTFSNSKPTFNTKFINNSQIYFNKSLNFCIQNTNNKNINNINNKNINNENTNNKKNFKFNNKNLKFKNEEYLETIKKFNEELNKLNSNINNEKFLKNNNAIEKLNKNMISDKIYEKYFYYYKLYKNAKYSINNMDMKNVNRLYHLTAFINFFLTSNLITYCIDNDNISIECGFIIIITSVILQFMNVIIFDNIIDTKEGSKLTKTNGLHFESLRFVILIFLMLLIMIHNKNKNKNINISFFNNRTFRSLLDN